MIAAAITVTILVALTILVHYEVLRVASALIPEERHVRPRFRVVLVEKFWPMHGDRKMPLASAKSLRGRHAAQRKDDARGL